MTGDADSTEVPEPAAAGPAAPPAKTTADPGGTAPLTPAGIVAPPPDYTADGVPSLDFVRDKIEGRFAHSLGSSELAEQTPEAVSVAKQAADRERAGREKLEAIRRSLHGEPPS